MTVARYIFDPSAIGRYVISYADVVTMPKC